MRSQSLLSLAVIAALTVSAIAANAADPAQVGAYKLKVAQTGAHSNLASLKGKYKAIYIDVFASWCGPCQRAIPEVIKLNSRLKSKGLAVIGLALSDEWAAMQQDIKVRGINYPVFYDEKKTGLGNLLGIEAFPTVIVLDGKTLKEKGRWKGFDPSGGQLREEIGVLKSLGVKA